MPYLNFFSGSPRCLSSSLEFSAFWWLNGKLPTISWVTELKENEMLRQGIFCLFYLTRKSIFESSLRSREDERRAGPCWNKTQGAEEHRGRKAGENHARSQCPEEHPGTHCCLRQEGKKPDPVQAHHGITKWEDLWAGSTRWQCQTIRQFFCRGKRLFALLMNWYFR